MESNHTDVDVGHCRKGHGHAVMNNYLLLEDTAVLNVYLNNVCDYNIFHEAFSKT